MPRIHLFADEAGDFSFKRDAGASRYFMICTVAMNDCSIDGRLLSLRRDMTWRGLPVAEEFHATTDRNEVREEVFSFIQAIPMRVDATVLDKPKAQPQTRTSEARFYQHAWFYHLRHLSSRALREVDEVTITAAALGTRKGKKAYADAVDDVARQTVRGGTCRAFFPRSIADPCLQVADYCAWAIQRKWERDDERWHALIADKIHTEYDLWSRGGTQYY